MTDDKDENEDLRKSEFRSAPEIMEQMIDMLFDEALGRIAQETPDREAFSRLSVQLDKLRRECKRYLAGSEDP